MQDLDLEIPAFLRRDKNETPKPIVERKTRQRKLTAKEELEQEVRRIASARWHRRTWGVRRPSIRSLRKQVREELKAAEKKNAGGGR